MVIERLPPRFIHLGAVLAVLAFPWIVKVNAQPVTPKHAGRQPGSQTGDFRIKQSHLDGIPR